MELNIDNITLKDTKLKISAWCLMMRKSNHETQIELASKLNVSHKTIANLEKGNNFTIDTLLKVLQYFDRLDLIYEFISDQVETEREKEQVSLY